MNFKHSLIILQKFNRTSIDGCSNNLCSDFNEDYKDTLFINVTVDDFIFGGYRHGVLRWIADDDATWYIFESRLPEQITREAGFALFNQKNDTALNE